MQPIRRRRLLHIAAGVSLLCASYAGAQAPPLPPKPVRVASKIDTEGALLGQLMVQTLEAGGIKTENRLQLGVTKIVRTALLAGEVDIYPEYTGNGAFFLADETHPAWKNAQAGYARVKALDQQRHQLVWLTAAPANNSWVIAVRKDLARQHKLVSLDDFSAWVRSAGGAGNAVKLAASAEFVERPDALPAFQAAYGFSLKPTQLLMLAGGDTALTAKAAAQGISGVNAAMAYGTDGPLAALGLVSLLDPKSAQPVYAPAPVVRAEVLARYPKIELLLAPVFLSLDNPTLQMLNARIALEGEDAKAVAAQYLKSKGFVR
jgi:osmoprotectant transport system substrate-binding protein